MKQTLKIKCSKLSMEHGYDSNGNDCLSALLINCDPMEVLEQLLNSASQQEVVDRVQEAVRSWREMEACCD